MKGRRPRMAHRWDSYAGQ